MDLVRNTVNAFKVVAGSGLASAFLIGANVLLARGLQPPVYGDYVTAFTLSNGGMFIAVYGMSQLMVQEFGRNKEFTPRFVRGAQVFMALCTVVACLVSAAAACSIGISPRVRDLTLLLLPVLVAQAAAEISSVYFQILNKPWLTGGWVAVLNLWRLIACVLFLRLSANIYKLPLYQSGGAIVFSGVAIWLTYRMLHNHMGPKHEGAGYTMAYALREVAKEASPYAIAGLMYYATSQLPLLLFAAIAGPRETASYSIAYQLLSTLYFVPQMLMVRSLMMRYHTMATSEPERLHWLYREGSKWIGLAGLCMAAICFVAIPFVIHSVFGDKYNQSIPIAQIMLICLPLRFMTVNVAAVVVAGVSIWYKNFADIASGVFAVIVFSILIHLYGRIGGAIAAVLVECMYLGSHIFLVEKFTLRTPARVRSTA